MIPRLSRRSLVLGAVASVACSRKAKDAPPLVAAPSARASAEVDAHVEVAPATRVLEWSFDARGPSGRAAIVVPTWGGEAGRFPVVIALHGHGEAMKDPREGALGWPNDYALTRAIARVREPPLTADDLEGFADADRLAGMNRDLEARPFGGLVVACPYLPDLSLYQSAPIAAYGAFLVGEMLERVRREAPAIGSAASTGIDGVSQGGAIALRVGLSNAAAFGAVGALQPALSADQIGDYVELAVAAKAKNPALRLRLTTSHEDVYRDPITRLSNALRAAGVAHDFADVPGPHDYAFNRGPGAYELLLWHDRVLAR